MANINFPTEGLCSDNPVTPSVTGDGDATRFEWSVLSKPAGAQVIFSSDSIAEPQITVTEDGEYEFQLCCYFDEGIVDADAFGFDAGLNCPIGVIAGQVATIYLTNCEDGSINNFTATGPAATGITFSNDGVGSVTTDIDQSGPVDVSVDCTLFDDDGVATTTTFTCQFEVIPVDTELVFQTTSASTNTFITCGQSCRCDTAIVVFDCGVIAPESAEIGLVFIDCPPCPEDEECEQLVRLPMIGSPLPDLQPVSTFDCGCYEENIYAKDKPVLFWNNICACPGWTIEADAVEGSSIYNACSCSSGQKWCFEGSATITAISDTPILIDSMIIWGHDMTNGSVVTSLSQGEVRQFGVIGDDACIEGYTAPVVLNFGSDDGNNPLFVSEFEATITNNNGGLTCIDHIFIGAKKFLPDDSLPEDFQNPHDGSDYELEIETNDCGPLSRRLKHVPVPMSFTLSCLDLQQVKEFWRPYIRYAQRHGVLFQWSRNNCPQDLFYGWIQSTIQPSTYTEDEGYSVTLEAEGFTTQPQPVLFDVQ